MTAHDTTLDGWQLGERAATVAPSSWNPETHTVEVIAATEAPAKRRDAAGEYLEILDMAALDLSGMEGLPVFDHHRAGGVRETIGIVQSARIEGDKLVAVLRLSTADDAAPVVHRVAEGIAQFVSLGYAVSGPRTEIMNGQRQRRYAKIAAREVSFTPTPLDHACVVRSETPPDEQPRSGSNSINKRGTTGGEMPKDTTPESTLDSPEIERRSEIRGLCRAAGLDDQATDALIDEGATVEQAKAALWDHVQKRSAPIIRTTSVQNDDPAVIVRRQSEAVAARMGAADCPDDARKYVDLSMLDLARSAVERAGVSTRGMGRDEVLERAAHTTSDFPLIVSNAMGKTAAQAYRVAESPIKTLFRKRTLSNFKPATAIRLGNMGRLEPMAESGEFKHTTRAENGESMSLSTFGRAINVSRNLIIDDDLGLLGDITSEFGTSAAQTEAELMVAELTGNPNLSDGTPVFDASRGNIAASGADPSETTLDTARKAMRGVKGLDGKTIIDVKPKYLVIGPELETSAEKLLASIYSATTEDVNPFAGKLSLMVEPRIEDDSWFLFADPARLPCLQYGHLAGAEGVQIQRSEAWDTLGIRYRAWLDWGCGWLDWRGAWFNEGAT